MSISVVCSKNITEKLLDTSPVGIGICISVHIPNEKFNWRPVAPMTNAGINAGVGHFLSARTESFCPSCCGKLGFSSLRSLQSSV